MSGRHTMKDALALAPMDDCVLPRKSNSREWWRYGWAWGFLERNLTDAQAPVREKRFRDAIAMGYTRGKQRRAELEAAGTNA